MATTGYLVYRWKGRYYPLYNHQESGLSVMGIEIINQIIEWMVRFDGSTQKVKEYLSSLLEKVTFQTEDTDNYSMMDPVYECIESRLLLPDQPIVIVDIPIGEIPSFGGMILYCWTIDIDTGYLEMKSWDCLMCLPWRYLYQIRFDRPWNFRDFGGTIGLIKLQAYVRKFLANRRALCPPDGVHFLLAKRRFEGSQRN
jgi:hypothetical protein